MADGGISTGVGNDGEEEEFDSSVGENFDLEDGENLAIEKPGKSGGFKKTLKRIAIGTATLALGVGLFAAAGIFGAGEEIVTISPSPIKSESNNQLIYITGTPTAQDFKDPIFNVTASGFGLFRVVEMYQWAQENGQYIKKWSDEPIDIPDETAKSGGYVNPPELPFFSEKWLAEKVIIGSFTIVPELIKQLGAPEARPLTANDFKLLHPEGQQAFKLSEGGYFFGLNPAKPNIGDLRITFKSYPSAPISILAKQAGEVIEPYLGKNGPIGVLRSGTAELKAMKQGLDIGGNSSLGLVLRGMSILFIIIGLLIAIGKHPFAKKQKKTPLPRKTTKAPVNETEDSNTSIAETHKDDEIEAPQEDSYNIGGGASHADDADFMLQEDIPRQEPPNFIDQRFSTAAEQKAPVAAKRNEIPTPLEFSYAGAAENNSEDVTSQLQQFGIIDEQASSAPPAMTPPPETTAPLDFGYNPGETSAPGLGVMAEHSTKAAAPPAPLELDIAPAVAAEPEVPPFDPQLILQPEPSYTQSNFVEDFEQIPDEVEVITEDEIAEEIQRDNEKQAQENIAETAPAIDFYPDRTATGKADINSEPDIAETTIAAEPERPLPPPPPLPPVKPEVAAPPVKPVAAPEKISPLVLPPPPDFDDIFKPAKSQETAVQKEMVAPQPPPGMVAPPPPDFDNLLPKAATPPASKMPAIPAFELPGIPDNFDPSVEMTAPQAPAKPAVETQFAPAAEPIDEEFHSPFGGGIDDPFATPEDEKN